MRKPRRVLVVEDDVDIRAMIELTLAAEGHEVLQASNGIEALEHSRRGGIDVVLLDLKMPVMDGFAFARAYRESGGAAPIVVLRRRRMPSGRRARSAPCRF